MFEKLVAVEDTLISAEARKGLLHYAKEVNLYDTFPENEEEIIRRIGNADAVLVSFKTQITKKILDACPNIRYIGMCCTLYEASSCNVDLTEARRKGITVTGVKDYGDEGVVEYAISELVRFMHGFGEKQWKADKQELTRQKVGIIGLGKTGGMLADAFRFFGSEVYYYSRNRKPEAEDKGFRYLDLDGLLRTCDIVLTCLPRNTYLLGDKEFNLFGNGKILMNTSIGATFDVGALKRWLATNPNSHYFCDGTGMGTLADELAGLPNVFYTPVVAGKSIQSTGRLSRKTLDNIKTFLDKRENI